MFTYIRECCSTFYVWFPHTAVTVITPHAQRERGKVIGCGVHIYIYSGGQKSCIGINGAKFLMY